MAADFYGENGAGNFEFSAEVANRKKVLLEQIFSWP
jgi:hypothetical protein